jgi:hypothetical protein
MGDSSLEGKGKGKQPATDTIAPLPNPAAGSANPAASLSALWGYIQPALDHLVRSQTTDPNKAPPIQVEYRMGIHTATYNYFTAQSESANTVIRHQSTQVANSGEKIMASGADLYEQLDIYMIETARELLLGVPQDDSMLIHYIVTCFNRYSVGVHSVNRLLNYVNRHYVKRAVDEDKGWLRLSDALQSVAKTITRNDVRQKISRLLKEKRTEELKKWGYEDGSTSELLTYAEACAEAASPPDRVVPVSSLALRRFRTEFIEPLLAVPKVKGRPKVKKMIQQPSGGFVLPAPKGRLARAVKELLEAEGGDQEERDRLTIELAKILKSVGVRGDHPLRKRVDKHVASLDANIETTATLFNKLAL